MAIYNPEKRFGTFNQLVTNSRKWENFNTDGASTGQGTVNQPNLMSKGHYRASKTSNKSRTITGFTEKQWRDPSNYARSFVQVEYPPSGEVTFVDPQGRLRRRESGLFTHSPALNYGPYMSSSLQVQSNFNTDNRCNTEALLKLKDMKVNFGEALAESRSTLNLLADSASTALRALLQARRGNWAGVHKTLGLRGKPLVNGKWSSSKWLEYQFGWMPLLSDVYGASELFKEGLRKKAQLFSVVRTITENGDIRPTNGGHDSSGSTQRKTRVKLYARVSDQDIQNLTSLGLMDPLQVGWALVPFSFAVDWFFPVGNFLEALGATRGLTFVGGFRSWRVTGNMTHHWRPIYLGYGGAGQYTAHVEIHGIRRVRLYSFPTPIPYFKSPFSTSHVVSAAALIRQQFR